MPPTSIPGLIGAFQMDGKTYGLPKDWSSLAMVYDTKAFTDAGIANPPTNWDELKAAAQALKDKAGEPRIVIPPDIAREFAFHYAAGAKVISDDGTSIVIDSPEGRHGARLLLRPVQGRHRHHAGRLRRRVAGRCAGQGLRRSRLRRQLGLPIPARTNAPDLDFGICRDAGWTGRQGNACLHGLLLGLRRDQAARSRLDGHQLPDRAGRHGQVDLARTRHADPDRTRRRLAASSSRSASRSSRAASTPTAGSSARAARPSTTTPTANSRALRRHARCADDPARTAEGGRIAHQARRRRRYARSLPDELSI